MKDETRENRIIAISLAISILNANPIGELIEEENPELTEKEAERLEYRIEKEIFYLIDKLQEWKANLTRQEMK